MRRLILLLFGHWWKSHAAFAHVWTVLDHGALLDVILVIIVTGLEDVV